MFPKKLILENFESLRKPNGAFSAAPTPDYQPMWLRDTLYCAFAYSFWDEFDKAREGVWIVFDYFKKYKETMKTRIASPMQIPGGILHAKVNADTLEPVTSDYMWGHHQLDALGLFLHVVADLEFKNFGVVRNEEDREIIQFVVFYLRSVEYWYVPDCGIWEKCNIRHSSSIGAVLAGLSYVKKQRLAIVPDSLIHYGEAAFREIWPFESRDACSVFEHNHDCGHDCDSAQLTLIWPFHWIASIEEQDALLVRLIHGHRAKNGKWHRLLQTHGLNRHWTDDYYRSDNGVSAEWPMFKFWVSIIYSQRHDFTKAIEWFTDGCKEIIDGEIPELFKNGAPNDHNPLAWAHAIALIAFSKLPPDVQKQLES